MALAAERGQRNLGYLAIFGVTVMKQPEQSRDARIRSFVQAMLTWYESNRRDYPWRHHTTPGWQLLVAEILLQRTNAEQVARLYWRFFKEYPELERLSRATSHELEAVLMPLGLQRKRARILLGVAKALVERGGDVPESVEGLMELPGVGQYVAGVFVSRRTGIPAPAVDSNIARVLRRVFAVSATADVRTDKATRLLSLEIAEAAASSVGVAWALVDFAAAVCRPRNPACQSCPAAPFCAHYAA